MDVASDPADVAHLLSQLRVRFPHLPVIAMTNYGDMKQAATALEAGAVDYMSRPVSHQRLQVGIDNAIKQYRLALEVSRLNREQVGRGDLNYLPADSIHLKNLMCQNPNSDKALFLVGEPGVGKEALARAIHLETMRKERPFISVNCAFWTERQMCSMLFGAKDGEFPSISLVGTVASALGGTLFLEEVHRLSAAVQNHLIEVLQQLAEIGSAGDNRGKKGVRLMVGSCLSLTELRSSGILVPQLVQHLSDEVVTLPPLRDSKEDIAALAHYFTERFALQENPAVRQITDQAVELLQSYDWPGNLLELERMIFRAVISSEDSMIDIEHLVPYMPSSFTPEYSAIELQDAMMRSRCMPLTNQSGEVRRLRDLEADMINFALKFYGGRISEVARKLGIGRSTLYRKLHDLDIKVA